MTDQKHTTPNFLERWARVIRSLPLRQTCRECRLLKVEAEDINCPCLPRWPNGLRG
jgi:hypothetical protein